MGFQDRDYYRESDPYSYSVPRKQPRSIIYYLIMINVIVWILDILSGGKVSEYCALQVWCVGKPLEWYRFLTYGFCHSLHNITHLLFNMLGLYFLGRYVEERYGKREFLFFYLFSIVLSGIYWAGAGYLELLLQQDKLDQMGFVQKYLSTVVGASGAVTAVTILLALNFPRVTLFLWGILPVPAFALGIFIVVADMFGAAKGGTNIAHSVHLAGAAFAFLYFIFKFRFCAIFGHGRPRVRVAPERRAARNWDVDDYVDDSYGYAQASPSEEELRKEEEFRKLQAEVDELLKKISMHGMSSLTPEELAKLRDASQKYRTRR